jgi:predicted dehydrogenase
MSGKRLSRRDVLRGAAGGAALAIVPRHVLGGPGRTPPSETITRGVIGCGYKGQATHIIPNSDDAAPVTLAVCDVDSNHLADGLRKAGRGCTAYKDFRRVMERKDINTIHVVVPPHWHSLVCIAAAQAGKDILCEKPMTKFIREGRAVVEAVRRHGVVFQIGTYGRFNVAKSPREMARRKLAAGGAFPPEAAPRAIVRRTNWNVRIWIGRTDLTPQPVPGALDYDFWLGPAPWKPYHPHRVHNPAPGQYGMSSFRAYWDYEGGGLGDMGQHHLDGVQYLLAKDATSPVRVRARAPWPAHPDACGLWGWVEMTYSDGTVLVLDSTEWGERYPGEDRWPRVADLSEEGRRSLAAAPEPEPLLDFATAVRTRRPAGGGAEASHRCATLIHLANIAIRTGREIRYDPVAERIVGDEEANRLVDVPMRPPWRLPC